MNSIIKLLDLKDTELYVSDIKVEETRKLITLETKASPDYCPAEYSGSL